MADFIIRVKDKNNVLIKEIISPIPVLDTAPQGTELHIECRERGYKVQYTGNYFTKSSERTEVTPSPNPNPTPVPGTLLFDVRVAHPELFNGSGKTYETIGLIPNGHGLETRASGNPRIVANADNTFSLVCDSGHGRFYGHTRNYNARIEIEAAWWNQVSGQDCSIKLRSRHQESDPCSNRFGGYGFSFDRSGYDSKRETCHNNHDQSTSGSIGFTPQTKQYWLATYQVKDVSGGVEQIATINGNQVMKRTTARQVADPSLFDKISYYWIRQNIDSGTGELRIKNLRVYAV